MYFFIIYYFRFEETKKNKRISWQKENESMNEQKTAEKTMVEEKKARDKFKISNTKI